MNKFSNLSKLFNEIELLESAGLYKSANVLHKKFVKEAQQYYPSNSSTREDRAPILNPGFDTSMQIRDYILQYAKDIKSLGTKALIPKTTMNLKEQDFINKVKQGQIDPDKFDENNVSDYAFISSNQANTPNVPRTTNQGAAYSDSESAMTKGQLFAQGLGDAATEQKRQNTTLNNSFNKIFEGLGSSIKSKKTQPILNEKEENAVYKRTVDQIRSILSRKNVPDAEKLAKDYQNYFSNPQRNVAFQNQVNRIFSEFKQKSPFGSSVASQPQMSDEEGQTLTQLVNTNVQRNMQTNGNAQPNTQPTNNPSVAPNIDTNNQLYQIVSNFYRYRDVTVTSPEQMYADLKADPARKNVVRNHIRTSKNPNTNQLVALFDSKTK